MGEAEDKALSSGARRILVTGVAVTAWNPEGKRTGFPEKHGRLGNHNSGSQNAQKAPSLLKKKYGRLGNHFFRSYIIVDSR